jgi:hypothetical protein
VAVVVEMRRQVAVAVEFPGVGQFHNLLALLVLAEVATVGTQGTDTLLRAAEVRAAISAVLLSAAAVLVVKIQTTVARLVQQIIGEPLVAQRVVQLAKRER